MTEKKEVSTAAELKKTDEVAKTTQSEVKKEVAEQKEKETIIYIGPNLPGGLSQYSVYNNGLSRSIQNKIDKMPELGQLFINVTELPDANKQLQDESSSFFAAFAVVKSKKGEL